MKDPPERLDDAAVARLARGARSHARRFIAGSTGCRLPRPPPRRLAGLTRGFDPLALYGFGARSRRRARASARSQTRWCGLRPRRWRSSTWKPILAGLASGVDLGARAHDTRRRGRRLDHRLRRVRRSATCLRTLLGLGRPNHHQRARRLNRSSRTSACALSSPALTCPRRASRRPQCGADVARRVSRRLCPHALSRPRSNNVRRHRPNRQRIDAARILFWNAERLKFRAPSAEMIRRAKPDVVILCELDLGMARTGNRHVTADLADALGAGYPLCRRVRRARPRRRPRAPVVCRPEE